MKWNIDILKIDIIYQNIVVYNRTLLTVLWVFYVIIIKLFIMSYLSFAAPPLWTHH
jgi:hypothetical protein